MVRRPETASHTQKSNFHFQFIFFSCSALLRLAAATHILHAEVKRWMEWKQKIVLRLWMTLKCRVYIEQGARARERESMRKRIKINVCEIDLVQMAERLRKFCLRACIERGLRVKVLQYWLRWNKSAAQLVLLALAVLPLPPILCVRHIKWSKRKAFMMDFI